MVALKPRRSPQRSRVTAPNSSAFYSTVKFHPFNSHVDPQTDQSDWLRYQCLPPTYDQDSHRLNPPINQLPVEILGEIFASYIAGGEGEHEQAGDDMEFLPSLSVDPWLSGNPFILGLVSAHWRNITLSTPTLWSTISVRCPIEAYIPRVQLWLERAGTSPLTLYLEQNKYPSSREARVTSAILSLFTQHCKQWKSISFDFHSLEPQLARVKGPFNYLEYADIYIEECDFESRDNLWRSIHTSPTLRHANWYNHYHYQQFPSHIPWYQLTHVNLGGIPINWVLSILGSCHNLETVCIALPDPDMEGTSVRRDTFYWSMPPPPPTFVTLTHLRKLEIRGFSHPRRFLDHITLPALEFIELTLLFESNTSGPIFGDLFKRSSREDVRLTLRTMDLPDGEIAEMLMEPSMSVISQLQLSTRVTSKLVEVLTCTTSNDGQVQCYLPRLTTVGFFTNEAPTELVSEMVYSRWRQHHKYINGEGPLVAFMKPVMIDGVPYPHPT